MYDDEQEIKYVYDEQNRLIAARWFEQPNVTVFDYSHLGESDAAPVSLLESAKPWAAGHEGRVV